MPIGGEGEGAGPEILFDSGSIKQTVKIVEKLELLMKHSSLLSFLGYAITDGLQVKLTGHGEIHRLGKVFRLRLTLQVLVRNHPDPGDKVKISEDLGSANDKLNNYETLLSLSPHCISI